MKNNIALKIAEGVVGILIAAGAGASWHFWGVDPLVAVIMGLGGLGMTGHAFGYNFNF